MKMKKGICLLLCAILLVGLLPAGALAAYGPGTAGDAYASICLTGGMDKTIYSADSAIEQKILYPDELTEACYLLPDGVSYDAASNTLSLTDFSAPSAVLSLTMMGGDFKIRLSGSSALAAIRSDSRGWGGSVTFTGDGSLDVANYSGAAITIDAGGAADFVRVEPQVRLDLTGAGSAIDVIGTSCGDGAISFDTASPDVRAEDSSYALTDQLTSDGSSVDVCTRSGEDGLFGLEAVIDPETESLVYNVYRLGEKDDTGAYSAELAEENVEDISAYSLCYTPHEWSLYDVWTGARVSQVRLARFSVSAQAADENGSVSVSQSAVGRGGSALVTVQPNDGYKLALLTVNGVEVTPTNGSYTIGGITADQVVEASFAEAAPVRIAVTAPETTDFSVPGVSDSDFVSEPFLASVTDGADEPVGATVDWSVTPALSGVSIRPDGCVVVTAGAKDVIGDEGLAFTVTAAVRGAELSDDSGSFTVSLAERKPADIRMTRDGEALEGSDTVTIPAEGITTASYGAIVTDQYGKEMDEETAWIAGDWPVGVSRQDNTLSVTNDAKDGSTLDVTVSAASDSTVADTVTVSFVASADEPETTGGDEIEAEPETASEDEKKAEPETAAEDENKAEPETSAEDEKKAEPETAPEDEKKAEPETASEDEKKAEPETASEDEKKAEPETASEDEKKAEPETTAADEKKDEAETTDEEKPQSTALQTASGDPALTITWPTVTLADKPVYGIAWNELVTLGEDGAVTKDDAPVEGSFTVKAESALPNVSDSFTILFTYIEDEEEKAAESEAQTVTLSPRKLSADMITLSPAEMPYTGTACEPAVSLKDGDRALVKDKDYTVTGYADNVEIGKDTAKVTVAGQGNYTGSAEKSFSITPIPASALTEFITSRKAEDEGIEPTVEVKYGDTALKRGEDYDLSFLYDIPSKTGSVTITLKGRYIGTIVSRFDLPNYLITEGAGGSWNKGSSSELGFTANGALSKFTELTVDGKTVDPAYYSAASGSTVIELKPSYLKSLSAGKHIIGVAYEDGKALAIFSVTDINRRGVATGDENDMSLWITILGVSVAALAVLCVVLAVVSRRKAKRKKRTTRK